MAATAYNSITITDLLDTATYIYYSSTNSRTTDSTNLNKWHISPESGDIYIGIYSGPPKNGGQPNPSTSGEIFSNILTDTENFIISKYVGNDGRSVVSIIKTGTNNNIDTYTITYSNGETSTFTITNGVDGASSQWYFGTEIDGTSSTATSFPDSGITNALLGDMYLNTSNSNIYKCTYAGNASTAKWVYAGNIAEGAIRDCILNITQLYYLTK